MHKQWRDEITLPTSASIHVNYQNPWALFPVGLKEESQATGMYPGPSGTLWDSPPALCAHFCLTCPLSWPPLASCTEQQLVLVHSCSGDGAPLKWVTGTTWCKCLFLSFHCREPWVTPSVVPSKALWVTPLLLLQVKGLEFGVAQKRARESKGWWRSKVPGGSTLQCLLDGAFLAVASRAALGSIARHLVLFVGSWETHTMLFIDTRAWSLIPPVVKLGLQPRDGFACLARDTEEHDSKHWWRRAGSG